MSEQDPRLLSAAVDWHLREAKLLSAAGVQSRVVGPSTGRSKNSVTIELISSRLLIGVIIWDSGEGEVIRDSPDQPEPVVEVLWLLDDGAVRDLLDTVKLELTARA